MSDSKINVWHGTLGKSETFEGFHNTHYIYGFKPPILDKLNYCDLHSSKVKKLKSGDYENNVALIDIGWINAVVMEEKTWIPYYNNPDEEGYWVTELQNNEHIVHDLWAEDNPTGDEVLWNNPDIGDHEIPLRSKERIKNHIEKILGEQLFGLLKDKKIKLLINSCSEVSPKQLVEFILFIFDYIGIDRKCVSVLLNNSMDMTNPQITTMDFFLQEFSYDLAYILPFVYDSFPFDDKYFKFLEEYKKPKKYLCYNANLHGHRLFVLNWLFYNGLDKDGIVSAINRQENDRWELQTQIDMLFNFQETKYEGFDKFDKKYKQYNFTHDYISTLYDKLPINLDVDHKYLQLDDGSNIHNLLGKSYGDIPHELSELLGDIRNDRYIHTEHFTDTYFSLVTETTWESLGWGIGNLVRVTEKIYKAVALHPFIVIGNKHTLKYLHSVGFKTFPEMFDESYDEIDDPLDRMVFIMREVERLCKMDIEELHKIYVSVLPKIKHNQKILSSIDGGEMLYNKLRESIK